MTQTMETGEITGTRDKDYDIVRFTQACLSNVLRLETFIEDARRNHDDELVEFFTQAQADSHKGAERGKQLLAARLSPN